MKEFPKTFKYGRVFRIKTKKSEYAKNFLNVNFYEYGLKSLENKKLRLKHFNAITRLLKKLYKKEINIKYNISLLIPVTQKPLETRMGKGKGERYYWECIIKKGYVVFEIGNTTTKNINVNYGLKLVSDRLSFKTKLVKTTY